MTTKKPRGKKPSKRQINPLIPFFALAVLGVIVYALGNNWISPSGAATSSSTGATSVLPGRYPVPVYDPAETPDEYMQRIQVFINKYPTPLIPIPWVWEDADIRREGTPVEEFTARLDAWVPPSTSKKKFSTVADFEEYQIAYMTATSNLPWVEYQENYWCKVKIVSHGPTPWGYIVPPSSSHPGLLHYYDPYGCAPGDIELFHQPGEPPTGPRPTSNNPGRSSGGSTGSGSGDIPGPGFSDPLSPETIVDKDSATYKASDRLCFLFKNLAACKFIFGIEEARQGYVDYLLTKAQNGSAYHKLAYAIMSKYFGKEGKYFENEEGTRVRVAAEAIKAFVAAQTGPSAKPWEIPAVKAAKDKGIIKATQRGYPEYVPYQDTRYTKLYYYRCGPFDLVGTLKVIEEKCTESADITRDPDGLDAFSYDFDATKALLVDMQAANRAKFDNGIPPFIVKYGSYVYADDDTRMSVLTYPWFMGTTHQQYEEAEIDGKMETILVNKDVTYGDPLRDLGGRDSGGTYDGFYYNYLGVPDFSSVLITSKEYTGDPAGDRPYINRYNEVLNSNDREVTPNTLSLEWVRSGGNEVRKVFTVKVNEAMADNPPTIYARDGDVVRYYIAKNTAAEIISQPLRGGGGAIEDKEVPDADSWGLTFAPIAARLDTTNSNMTPIYKVGGVTVNSYGRVYEYQVGFGDEVNFDKGSSNPGLLTYPIHRVRYRIQSAGNTGSMFLSNPDLFNNDGTYGYILQEVSYKKGVHCPRTNIPTNNGFGLLKKVCLPRIN